MKIKDMNPDQLREYNRVQKQNQRERERQEAAAKRIPNANDVRMPIAKQAELDKNANDTLKTIQAELPDHTFVIQDEFVIEAVACALLGFESNIIQKVQNPDGMLVGGHFPDAVASTAVEHVHRFPNLLGSATFKSLYEQFLRAVVTWDGKYQHAYSSPELIHHVRSELAGNYVLKTPAVPVPATPPAPIEPVDVTPSDEEIRERGRVQLLNQLRIQDPSIPPQAQRFLEYGR
jgi:hypothetical protein